MEHQQSSRNKLTKEFIPNYHQRRISPCLRKIVLCSNLLSNQNSINDNHHFKHQSHSSHLLHNNHHQNHQTQNQTELDWFEHLMEEIDDSDSESDSSDHNPKSQNQSTSTSIEPNLVLESASNSPLNIIHVNQSSLYASLKRLRSLDVNLIEDKALCHHLSNHSFRRVRPRITFISSLGQNNLRTAHRKQTRRHLRKKRFLVHPHTRDSVPYWGWITSPHFSISKNSRIDHFSNSSGIADDSDGQTNLPSLLSSKSSYLFKSMDPIDDGSKPVQHHDFGIEHDLISKNSHSLVEPRLNSIDFSPYDFLISTTTAASHNQDHPILQVKYLIGNLGKFTRRNSSHSTRSNEDRADIHTRIGKQQRKHHSHSSSRGLIVKKFHIVLNHALDLNDSHLNLHYFAHNYHPGCLLHSFDPHSLSLFGPESSTFAWKIYGLHRP